MKCTGVRFSSLSPSLATKWKGKPQDLVAWSLHLKYLGPLFHRWKQGQGSSPMNCWLRDWCDSSLHHLPCTSCAVFGQNSALYTNLPVQDEPHRVSAFQCFQLLNYFAVNHKHPSQPTSRFNGSNNHPTDRSARDFKPRREQLTDNTRPSSPGWCGLSSLGALSSVDFSLSLPADSKSDLSNIGAGPIAQLTTQHDKPPAQQHNSSWDTSFFLFQAVGQP